MENASKALIIAGAILISILIIGIGMAVINATTSVTGGTQNAMDKQELETFNSNYTTYVGENKRGSQVTTLINAIIASNGSYEDYPIKLTYGGTTYEGENISSVLKSVKSTKKYDIDVKMDKTGRVNEIVVTESGSSSNP